MVALREYETYVARIGLLDTLHCFRCYSITYSIRWCLTWVPISSLWGIIPLNLSDRGFCCYCKIVFGKATDYTGSTSYVQDGHRDKLHRITTSAIYSLRCHFPRRRPSLLYRWYPRSGATFWQMPFVQTRCPAPHFFQWDGHNEHHA